MVGPCQKHFRHPYPQRMLITRKLRAATTAWVSLSSQRGVDDLIVPSLGPIAADKRGRCLSNGLSLFPPQAPGVIPALSDFSLPLPKSCSYCSSLPSTICLSTASWSLSLEHLEATNLGDSIPGSARLCPLGTNHSSMHVPKQPAPGHGRGPGEIYLIKCL